MRRDQLAGVIQRGMIDGVLMQQQRIGATIAAGGDVILDLSFMLGVDQALGVFEKTALAYVEDLLAGGEALPDRRSHS